MKQTALRLASAVAIATSLTGAMAAPAFAGGYHKPTVSNEADAGKGGNGGKGGDFNLLDCLINLGIIGKADCAVAPGGDSRGGSAAAPFASFNR